MKRLTPSLCTAAWTLAAVISALPANAQEGRVVLARGAESYGPVTPYLTAPLSEASRAPEWRPGDPIREIPRRFYPLPGEETKPGGEGLPDPLLDAHRAPAAPTITLGVNVAGTGFTGATPPDTVGDVGPNHYVQAVNASRIAIFDKAGALLPGYPITLSTLAPVGTTCRNNASGDPIVLYDQLADRWLLQEFTGGGDLCFYISQTPDPTGAYYFYSFDPPSFPDYPHFGVWPDAYYGTTNEAGGSGNQTTYAFNRVAMLAGLPATMQRITVVPPVSGYGFQTLTAADHDGAAAPPANARGIFMRHRDGEAHGDAPAPATDELEIWEMDVDFAVPANTTVTTLPRITITDFNSWMVNYTTFFSVPQPSSTTRLDPIREVIMQRLNYRNFGSHEALVGVFSTNRNPATSGTVVSAGLRWFELRRVGGIGNPWTLFQEGTFGGDTNSATANFFMGAIAMDGSGNIALGYNKTDTAAPAVFPSLGITGRLATDAAGTLATETPLTAGVQSQGSGRWGDYATMSIDPADDCTFWFTGEYMPGSSWGTRVASFVFEECLFGFVLSPTPDSIDVCAATDPDPQFTLNVTENGGWNFNVNLAASGLPPSTTASFTNNGSVPNFTSTFTVNGVAGSTVGTYPITITGTGNDSPATVRNTVVNLNLAIANPGAFTLTAPANSATGISLVPTLSWAASAGAASYTVEVATDAGFTTIVYSASGITGTTHQVATALAPSTPYFWRVTANNVCADLTSAVRSFTTVAIVCQTFASTNVPLPVPPTGTSGTTVSTLTVPAGGVISDVNVRNLVGTHTFMGDLNFNLTSPAATSVQFMGSACGTAENFNINFDDEAAPGPWPCPPTTGGTFRPTSPLSAFDGQSSPGTWTLTINDTASGDSGVLQSWSVEICIENTQVFADGFNAGNTSAWSSTVP
ncbi:MAG: proprotein convertase P-domain-containing protein [Thermoanaerobaculia bacterium]|nr:proprotein convertase P-domain-containing protein [Thermoanaerobaculia bacterium]